MNARAAILDAIRRAAVPASPAAVTMTGEPGGTLLEQFLAMLQKVSGRGVVRGADQSLHELVRSLVSAETAGMLIRGRFAVAENGAVYVDADDLGDRTDVVRAEHLMIVVPVAAIVATMHEAVRLIPRNSRCGWFLSGPSKTADIEQSLVIGAQGARTLHVILEP
jgi:L-lactate dehydrogenase complex protein LldG